jgi:hypothetical protein
MSELEEITRKLVSLSIEKRLRDSLLEVAGELPEEVVDDLYHSVYRPVMVTIMKNLLRVVMNK